MPADIARAYAWLVAHWKLIVSIVGAIVSAVAFLISLAGAWKLRLEVRKLKNELEVSHLAKRKAELEVAKLEGEVALQRETRAKSSRLIERADLVEMADWLRRLNNPLAQVDSEFDGSKLYWPMIFLYYGIVYALPVLLGCTAATLALLSLHLTT